ncbi:MAG: site-specific integrase [Bacteroides sp.]|nr:site-specific integrase [Bacteroides sp.]MCM1413885.1 site-specific integrase [Bacteroides sp.]
MKIRFNLQYPHHERSPIMAIVRGGGQQIKKSTGITVPTAVWDKTRQRCNEDVEGTVRFKRELKKNNKLLDEIADRWSRLRDFALVGNMRLDIDVNPIFKNAVKKAKSVVEEEDRKANRTPLEFFKEYADTLTERTSRLTKRYITSKTQGHHYVVLKRLQRFMSERQLPDNFDIFNEAFENRFTAWANSKRYAANTIAATFSILKVWLNAASREQLITTDYYSHYSTSETEVDAIALTEQEISAIYHLDIHALMDDGQIDKKSNIEATRDLFIIGCWTGLRRADLCRINEAVFDLEKNLLTIQTQKTSARVAIPLHPYVRELYAKYHGVFPKLIDKSKANSQLKELGRLAGVNSVHLHKTVKGGKDVVTKLLKYQLISFHTARRSFATNLYRKGAPLVSIMKMTGHTTESNFLKYIKITRQEHAEVMQSYINTAI